MTKMGGWVVWSGVAACVTAGGLSAQAGSRGGTAPHALVRLSGEVVVDGRSDEVAWRPVSPLPVTAYQPNYRAEPSERTEILVAYDDDYLYAAARMYDSDPTRIRASSLYRDSGGQDDLFLLLLDTFDDNDNARVFWTNPAGLRGDRALSADGGGANTSWNTYWDVAAVRDDTGWFAEMRIPFSSLGFQATGGDVVMGLTATRTIARKNEVLVFPDIDPDHSTTMRPSLARRVLLRGIRSQRPVYATPYALAGLGQTSVPAAGRPGYELHDQVPREVGLDLKYNLTPNLTLDASLNTDFAQVEADNLLVNLTRYSLFFPEKRQFFQERSGTFSFPTGTFSPGQLFHSRTIGIRDGEAVPILGGARLVGRAGEWDLGALSMQTEGGGGYAPENFSVLRARRRVINPYSYVGGIITSRLAEGGVYNLAYGLDGTIRVAGDDYLTFRVAQTADDAPIGGDGFDLREASLLQIQANRRRQFGFGYWVSATWAGRDYYPEMGFVTRRDYSELAWSVSRSWLMGEDTPLRVVDPIQFFGFVAVRNDDHSVESAQLEYDTDVTWKSGANVWFDLEWFYDDLRRPLGFPEDTQVPEGSYGYFGVEGGFGTPTGRLFRFSSTAGMREFYDGWRFNAGAGPLWNASRHLTLSAWYQVDVVRFPDRDQGFDAHILRLRSQLALDTRLSTAVFVQYSNVSDLISAQARLRYNVREGNDLWIVYNEGLNLDRDRMDPPLPRTDRRALLVKYTYTLPF